MKKLTAHHLLAIPAWFTGLFSVCACILIVVAPVACLAQDADSRLIALERRTPRQMSADDSTVLQAHGPDVVRAAEFYGIDLERGSWTYQQSICPLMPKHLILNYTRRESTGAETQFAAIVPRGAEPVRVVPVQKNGLAPFAPAETSQNSAAVFNHVWSSEGGDLKIMESESNWITLGLCYAEMVGSHPLIVATKPLPERNAGPPILRLVADGGAATVFNDIGMPYQTWSWTLAFDRHGVLRGVEREKLTQKPSQRNTAIVSQPMAPRMRSSPPPANTPATISPGSAVNRETVTVPSSATSIATTSGTKPAAASARILPDEETPPGRIIPDAQEAPAGRAVPDAQELPPAPK